MRVIVAAIGRLKDGGERDLFERYRQRFDQNGRGLSLGPLSLVELPESRLGDVTLRKACEAGRLLKAAASADLLMTLDEHGRSLTSLAFADHLRRVRDDGTSTIAFLIGGPDGHGPDVGSASALTLSLGSLTLPHGLARVVLAEQLYRATTILSGHPYHRA